jgi:LmbE family N-acetylglucosaminyl deacetylase
MHTTTAEPLDDRGRLLHDGDPAAQVALATVRLEAALAGSGRSVLDLDAVRVLGPDPAALATVLDVVSDRLAELGSDACVELAGATSLRTPGQLVALEPVLRPSGRLLVVVAHPDDEAFGCGSVIAHAAAHGLDVVVACATRGELGEPAPGSGLTPADLPQARERELREACALLGAATVELLDYRDSGVDGPAAPGSLAAADPVEVRDRVAALLDTHRPDVVVTLDASDGHRDHAVVRDATLAALDTAGHRPQATYLFCLARSLMTEFTGSTALGTPDAELTTVVDVAELLDLRWRAIRTHASQVPPFDAMSPALQHGFLAVDRLRRVDPPWPGGPVSDTWLPRPHSFSGDTIHTHHEGHHMSTTTVPAPADSLRDLCGGAVHLPGDPGYDAARLPWNVAVDLRPAAVALPRSAQDVVDVVRAAAALGLRVAPQSTGHGAGALAGTDLSDVVLVKLSELTGTTVDPQARTARVLGGTLWQDVIAETAPHGLTALHGSAGDVAVAGYALSGGLSFYGRQHGLAASSIRAVELVTAAGELVRADADHHPDLFWAVRGAGGNVGVVVAIELELLPIADVVAGMLLWDREHAPDVVRAWARWTREVPESVTTSLRIMSFPPLPELPPFLSGRQLVVVDGAVLEDDERAAELLAPLRALAPEMDTFGRIPAPALLQVHMDPPAPTPSVAEHCVLGPLGEDTIEALLAEVGPGTQSPLMFAELRQLGGALARPAEGGGAVSSLPGEYAVLALAVAATPEMGAAGAAAAQRLVGALAPWTVPGRVQTFTERPVDDAAGYPAGARARVAGLRAAYDPEERLVAAHRP